MISQTDLKLCVAELLAAKRILVVAHFNPDIDAYGSSWGLTLALQQIGKQALCVNHDGLLPRYGFLPGIQALLGDAPKDSSEYDLLVVCDCGDLKRLGDRFATSLARHPRLMNIDHHISNQSFGKFNLVDPSASSTCEIIYHMLDGLGVAYTPEVATCLLAGIYGDTGCFCYSSTSEQTFRIAAELTAAGASPHSISDSLFQNRSLAACKALGHVLGTMQLRHAGRYATASLDDETLKGFGASGDDTEGLVEELRSIAGVQVSAFFRQSEDYWKVSMRSVNSAFDVSKLAQKFGGGGHTMAAGFRWRGELAELDQRLNQLFLEMLGAADASAAGSKDV